ncbi:MAG TPA: ParB/RepB/Spo0J family partition protein [Solirubrobacterales bacterium]|jgi:ParB family chromosome partitioning protein
MSERRGIGRGLAAILPEGPDGDAELRELPVELIKPNPSQPRRRFDPESMDVLVASIQASGLVQPLLVRPLADGRYELIAGERRWRAAQEVGLERVPAVVRESAEAERLQTALVENMVREDLNPVEEARACAALVEDLELSKEEVGRRVGRSRSAISNLVRLLDLPDEALELLESGELSEGHGRAILQVRGNDVRRRLARDAAAGGWSVRETENRAKLASQPGRGGAVKRGRAALDPELREALDDAEEKLESALGHEVKLGVRGRQIRAEIRFDDLDELIALTRRLKSKRAA